MLGNSTCDVTETHSYVARIGNVAAVFIIMKKRSLRNFNKRELFDFFFENGKTDLESVEMLCFM